MFNKSISISANFFALEITLNHRIQLVLVLGKLSHEYIEDYQS